MASSKKIVDDVAIEYKNDEKSASDSTSDDDDEKEINTLAILKLGKYSIARRSSDGYINVT